MNKSICFYFQVHQPFRLREYHFFNIGNNHTYFDDYFNKTIMRKVAAKCYIPTNALMLELIKKHKGKFRISYSISGVALDQFQLYAPEVLESFQELAKTGCVEFLSETFSHSLSALRSKQEFVEQVGVHRAMIKDLFNQEPQVFRNTELIYSDSIGHIVEEMGYKAMLTEGARHILGWRSPNFLYYNPINPKLKLLLKNFKLSDDIAFRFSNRGWPDWPLTTEKYVGWLNDMAPNEEIINLFMDYETFGEHQWAETGIFEFLRALPDAVFKYSPYKFVTPTEALSKHRAVGPVQIPNPISWADEERDLTAWLGNDLQDDAFENLYALDSRVKYCKDVDIQRDWKYLQTSDHFYYMCTKFFSDGDVHKYFNHYDTPYQAFMNFMNVLSDFKLRVDNYYDTLNEIEKERVDINRIHHLKEQEKINSEQRHIINQLVKQLQQREQAPKSEKQAVRAKNQEESTKTQISNNKVQAPKHKTRITRTKIELPKAKAVAKPARPIGGKVPAKKAQIVVKKQAAKKQVEAPKAKVVVSKVAAKKTIKKVAPKKSVAKNQPFVLAKKAPKKKIQITVATSTKLQNPKNKIVVKAKKVASKRVVVKKASTKKAKPVIKAKAVVKKQAPTNKIQITKPKIQKLKDKGKAPKSKSIAIKVTAKKNAVKTKITPPKKSPTKKKAVTKTATKKQSVSAKKIVVKKK